MKNTMERKLRGTGKFVAVCMFALVSLAGVSADSDSGLKRAWKDFTDAGKSATKEVGGFFSEIGKEVKEEVGDVASEVGTAAAEVGTEVADEIADGASEATDSVKAGKSGKRSESSAKDADGRENAGRKSERKSQSIVGKWKHDSGEAVTTLDVRKNGTMEVTQRTDSGTTFWRGTYTDSGSALSFQYTESGTKGFFSEKAEGASGTWRIRYSFDGKNARISSSDIPADSAGNGFSGGALFKK